MGNKQTNMCYSLYWIICFIALAWSKLTIYLRYACIDFSLDTCSLLYFVAPSTVHQGRMETLACSPYNWYSWFPDQFFRLLSCNIPIRLGEEGAGREAKWCILYKCIKLAVCFPLLQVKPRFLSPLRVGCNESWLSSLFWSFLIL